MLTLPLSEDEGGGGFGMGMNTLCVHSVNQCFHFTHLVGGGTPLVQVVAMHHSIDSLLTSLI